MKLKYLLIAAPILAAFFLTNTVAAKSTLPRGCLDSIEGNAISGWAMDDADPNTNQDVKVVITSAMTGQVVKEIPSVTSIYRDDLAALTGSEGNCGFSVPAGWDEMEDGIYHVSAYASGRQLTNTLKYNKGNVDESAVAYRSLGVFNTTAYCACMRCCNSWAGITSTGVRAKANHTIAVDPKVIPYGTKVMINGVVYTAEDCGGGVNGKHIDIFQNSHGAARQYGVKKAEVFLVK